MSKRIQSKVSAFDELEFLVELGTRTIIFRVIRFASIIIAKFDPTTFEVVDITMGVVHVSFFMKVVLWLEKYSYVNG
jgi:hypothetical protein